MGFWVASFQRRATDVYPNLDFNLDLPSDEEAEESFSTNYSQEPGTPAEVHSPSSPFVPLADAQVPVLVSSYLMWIFILFFSCILDLFFFFVGPGAQDICCLHFNGYSYIYIYIYICVSAGAFHVFLYELHDLNRVYELGS